MEDTVIRPTMKFIKLGYAVVLLAIVATDACLLARMSGSGATCFGLFPDRDAAIFALRRWISRFNDEGIAGLADRPRCGRPRLGGRQLTGRIAALLARPG